MAADSYLISRLDELYRLNVYDPWQPMYLQGPTLEPYYRFPQEPLPHDRLRRRHEPPFIPLLPNQLFRAEGEFTGEVTWEDEYEGEGVPTGAEFVQTGLLVEQLRTRNLIADRVERQVFGVYILRENSGASVLWRPGRQVITTFVIHSVVPAGAPDQQGATKWPAQLIGMVTYSGAVLIGGWDDTAERIIPWNITLEVVVPPKPRPGPGRPKGSHDHPSLHEMKYAMKALQQRHRHPTRQQLMHQLGRQGDPRRVNEWLQPHGLNFVTFRRMTMAT